MDKYVANSNRLLFMHIPKTAGSSLNAYLEAQYPAAQRALHIENQVLGVPKDELPTFEGKNFLSAHLKYDTLKDVLDVQQYFTMTMLREPVAQTISHLGWMNKLGFPENEKELSKYPDYIKQIVERMHSMDLVSYFDTMNEHEKNFFDNCQTRYLLSVYGDVELTNDHLHQALLNLSEFNLIGLVEKFEESLILLAFFMNWQPPQKTPRRNPSNKKYFLDIETADDHIRDRFAQLTYYDQKLYDVAIQIFERQKRNVFQLIRKDYPGLISPSDDNKQTWQKLSKLQISQGNKAVHNLDFRAFLRKMKGAFF